MNRFFGGELVIKHQPFEQWRLEYHISHTSVDADNNANSAVMGTEKKMAHIRSYYNINDQWQLNSFLFYTDAKSGFDNDPRIDVNFVWSVNNDTELSFGVNHLVDGGQAQTLDPTRVNSVIDTGYFVSFSSEF